MSTPRIFIDGEAGTTGLKIRERLRGRRDLEILSIHPDLRKDEAARADLYDQADIVVLCLPDAAARDAVRLAESHDCRLIDASSAHRVAEGWTYGFPELNADAPDAIASADRVSNPGCHATGALALIAPLVQAGLIAADETLCIHSLSGYSGGGKPLIAEFEGCAPPVSFLYGLDQDHKHLPEITARSGLHQVPVFAPTVGRFAQGMAVQILLPLNGRHLGAIQQALSDHYAGAKFVQVAAPGALGPRLDPTALNGTNQMRLSVHGNTHAATLVAVLDNLGKGASGAAVQNLNLMIGADPATGL